MIPYLSASWHFPLSGPTCPQTKVSVVAGSSHCPQSQRLEFFRGACQLFPQNIPSLSLPRLLSALKRCSQLFNMQKLHFFYSESRYLFPGCLSMYCLPDILQSMKVGDKLICKDPQDCSGHRLAQHEPADTYVLFCCILRA